MAKKQIITEGDTKRIFLVYQAGIANVFEVDCFNLSPYGRNAKRLLQSSFRDCVLFAMGMGKAGAVVRTAACNKAGDIASEKWSEDLEDHPFFEKFIIVKEN